MTFAQTMLWKKVWTYLKVKYMKYICTRSIAGLVSFHQCWWWSDLWQNLFAVGKVRQAPAISRAIPTISSLRTWVRCARFSYGDATCAGEITPRHRSQSRVNPLPVLSDIFVEIFWNQTFQILQLLSQAQKRELLWTQPRPSEDTSPGGRDLLELLPQEAIRCPRLDLDMARRYNMM